MMDGHEVAVMNQRKAEKERQHMPEKGLGGVLEPWERVQRGFCDP